MTDQNLHYLNLKDILELVKERQGWGTDNELAIRLNVKNYEISRVKKNQDQHFRTQLRVLKGLRAYLLPEEFEWYQHYELWCEERVAKETTVTWADRWCRIQEERESTASSGDLRPHVPLQTLQPVPHFVGRKEEIKKVLEYLHPGHIVTLVGYGGIGKTQIAAKAVEHLVPGEDPPERFPDGIVFYTFYGENKNQAEKALEHIITSFGEKPGPSLDETVLHVLARKRALLVLDGAERADNLNRVLDVRGAQCSVLITSQRRTDIIEFSVDIDLLPFEAADILMLALGGDSAYHTNARKRIYDLVGDVTLAIDLAGAHLRDLKDEEGVQDYLAWLEDRRLEALHSGDHRRESVYVLMKRSVSLVSERLGEGVGLVLALMGTLAFQPVNLTVLAAALGIHLYDVKLLLEGLVNYSVLIREGNRYTVRHNMMYDYIKGHLSAPDEAIIQLATYYAILADEQSKRGAEGYHQLDPERAHMVAVVTGCAERHQWIEAQHLTKAVNGYLDLQGYWTDREVVLQVGLTAAQELKDLYAESGILNDLGIVYYRKGEWEQAVEFYQRSLHFKEQLGDSHGLAQAYSNLGTVYCGKGEWEQAIKLYQQSLQMSAQLGDIHRVARAYSNLGTVYYGKGEWERAIELHQQAQPPNVN